jgi:hypothetical protein
MVLSFCFLLTLAVAELCARYPRATELHLHLRGAPCVDENLVRETMRSLRSAFPYPYLQLGHLFYLISCGLAKRQWKGTLNHLR